MGEPAAASEGVTLCLKSTQRAETWGCHSTLTLAGSFRGESGALERRQGPPTDSIPFTTVLSFTGVSPILGILLILRHISNLGSNTDQTGFVYSSALDPLLTSGWFAASSPSSPGLFPNYQVGAGMSGGPDISHPPQDPFLTIRWGQECQRERRHVPSSSDRKSVV